MSAREDEATALVNRYIPQMPNWAQMADEIAAYGQREREKGYAIGVQHGSDNRNKIQEHAVNLAKLEARAEALEGYRQILALDNGGIRTAYGDKVREIADAAIRGLK